MQSSVLQGYPTQCPICTSQYEHVGGIEVVLENQKGQVIHMTCQQCQATFLVSLRIGPMGIIGMGVLTDLTKEEARGFLVGKSEISEDDVLSVYSTLKKEKVGVSDFFVE